MPEKLDPGRLKASNLAGQQVIRKFGSLGGAQFKVDHLKNCDVFVFDACDSITIDDCSNCNFILGPTSGSVFIRDTRDSKFAIASQQLRTRNCKTISVNLFCPTEPIVESSSDVTFLPWNVAIPNAKVLFEKAGLKPSDKNMYFKVHDFSKADDSIPQPHWSSSEKVTEIVTYDFDEGTTLVNGEIPDPLKSSLGEDLPLRTVHVSTVEPKQISGTVTWYNRAKGYGYISSTEGFDIFVHRHNLKKGVVLAPNGKVELTAALQLKGWHIVELLSYTPPDEAPVPNGAIEQPSEEPKQPTPQAEPKKTSKGREAPKQPVADVHGKPKGKPKKEKTAEPGVEGPAAQAPEEAKPKEKKARRKAEKEAAPETADGTGQKEETHPQAKKKKEQKASGTTTEASEAPHTEGQKGGKQAPTGKKVPANAQGVATPAQKEDGEAQEAGQPAKGKKQKKPKAKEGSGPKPGTHGIAHIDEASHEGPASQHVSDYDGKQKGSKKDKKQKAKQNGEDASATQQLDLAVAAPRNTNVKIMHYVDDLHKKMRIFLKESEMYVESLDNQQTLRKQIEFDPSSIIIAMEDDIILGTVYVLYNPWQAFIYHLCVHPKHRNKGVANMLMDQAESQLKARGIRCPTLFVEADNKSSSAFYKKRGWFGTYPFLCMGKHL